MAVIISKTSELDGWSNKELADLFWNELSAYVKDPMVQTLQNMKHIYLWAVHCDHELAKTFKEAMKWSGIDNIFTEFYKHGWEQIHKRSERSVKWNE